MHMIDCSSVTKPSEFPKYKLFLGIPGDVKAKPCCLIKFPQYIWANLLCYTSCTLTTLHCSKVSFLQCCHIKIYNRILTEMWGVHSLLWDTVYTHTKQKHVIKILQIKNIKSCLNVKKKNTIANNKIKQEIKKSRGGLMNFLQCDIKSINI